ncbi:actin-2-like [Pararge aegeria]|uniref:actin-2-like n=1 Tax=Pararge aegeria TaxID=116150 RepID=UPI0019D120B7|nr:actin-2-like [Pararge aegeria]
MKMASADIVTVVIDAGSQTTKAGFAGESFPRCVIPTTVGRFRQDGLLDCVPDVYFGHEAMLKRGISKLSWPINNGMVTNWDEMEKLLHHIFYRELHVAPEESQILVAMHPLIGKSDKERIAEILFESFAINSLHLATSSALVLHASGRTSGVVWENGYSCSYASPVFEGFPLKHATVCSNIAGDFLTTRLQQMLDAVGYSFTTHVERDILENIKADLCYVAIDYEEELKKTSRDTIKFNLPDGQHILVGKERFECPEVMFQPSLQGLSCPNIVDAICSSIKKCDIDYKALFFDNVVISGGSSMFKGLPERLSVELSRRVSELPGIRANVDAMPTRHYSI